jgi:hypothetical protein
MKAEMSPEGALPQKSKDFIAVGFSRRTRGIIKIIKKKGFSPKQTNDHVVCENMDTSGFLHKKQSPVSVERSKSPDLYAHHPKLRKEEYFLTGNQRIR